MKTVSHIIVASLLASGAAVANEKVNFQKHDANDDGRISQSEWQSAQLEASFDAADRNNDGVLTRQELRRFDEVELKQANAGDRPKKRGMEVNLSRIDENNDGHISQREWRDADVRFDFERVDRNNDGYITRQDIREIHDEQRRRDDQRMTRQDRQQRGDMRQAESVQFNRLDRNQDGYLSEREWRNANVDVDFTQLDRNDDGFVSERDIRQSDRVEMRSVSQQDRQQDRRQTEQYRESRQAFQETDRNRDQRVTRQEAQDAGYDYVVMYFEPLDMDRNDYLDDSEWTMQDRRDRGGDRAQAERAAKRMDRNQDDYISQREASANDYVVSHFESWDTDRDGYVDVAVIERALVEADGQGRQQDQRDQRRQQ